MDQTTGEDLNIQHTKKLVSGGEVGKVAELRNPERPSSSSFVPDAPDMEKIDKGRKRRANSQERWELDRIRAGGAIGNAELAEYDDDGGNVDVADDSGGE